MNPSAIRQAVIDALSSVAPEGDYDRLRPDRGLREQLDIDSMDYLNALITIDDRTGVEVPESDYGDVDTLAKLVAYIAKRAA